VYMVADVSGKYGMTTLHLRAFLLRFRSKHKHERTYGISV
jgi:hypothetical protein